MVLLTRVLLVLALLGGAAEPAQAQRDQSATAAGIGGSWYGRIESVDRARRYLEILGLEADGRGGYTAQTVFGWGDGSVSLVPAAVAVTPKTILSLTAPTGARLQIEFAGEQATGTYQAPGEPQRSIRFERLRAASNYGSLLGVWRADRAGETRVFDVKRVLTAGDGTNLVVGQIGFAETPDLMRQLVTPVRGESAAVRIGWTTATTAVELQRTRANELTGTFRRTDGAAAMVDKIVYRRTPPPVPEARSGSELGQRFPDFEMVRIDGKRFRLSEFRGKPVVINFFQAWCVWCLEEFAVWRGANLRYGDKLTILPVIYGTTSPEWMQQSEKAKQYRVPIYGVEKAPVSFRGIPQTWVVDKNGIVVDRMGYQAAHLMFARLDKVVK